MHIMTGDLVEWNFSLLGDFGAKRGRARIVEEGFVVVQNVDRYHGDSGGFHTLPVSRLTVVERGHLSIVSDNDRSERIAA